MFVIHVLVFVLVCCDCAGAGWRLWCWLVPGDDGGGDGGDGADGGAGAVVVLMRLS